jgi:hypothetical protein
MSNNKTRWVKDDPPNTLLAIDPGARYPKTGVPYAGAAYFQWGELVWAGLVKAKGVAAPFARPNDLVKRVLSDAKIPRTAYEAGEPLTVLAVEVPRIYKQGVARPEDIVQLATIAGAFVGGVDAAFYSCPRPSEWKGTIDKKILCERVMTIANTAERLIMYRAEGGTTSHVQDAFGLGLWVLGRMSTGGVV